MFGRVFNTRLAALLLLSSTEPCKPTSPVPLFTQIGNLNLFLCKRKSHFTKVTLSDFNSHVGSNPENCRDQHGGYGYGVSKEKRASILEFCAAVNLIVENTLFKKGPSHLAIYKSVPSKTQVAYVLVRRNLKFFERCKSFT